MESFESIGGVPKKLLVDNIKTVMDEPRTAYQSGKVNERLMVKVAAFPH